MIVIILINVHICYCSYINPLKLLMELEDMLDDDSILVADGGDFVGTAAYILR